MLLSVLAVSGYVEPQPELPPNSRTLETLRREELEDRVISAWRRFAEVLTEWAARQGQRFDDLYRQVENSELSVGDVFELRLLADAVGDRKRARSHNIADMTKALRDAAASLQSSSREDFLSINKNVVDAFANNDASFDDLRTRLLSLAASGEQTLAAAQGSGPLLPRPRQGDVDIDEMQRQAMAKIPHTRAYLAR